MQQITTPIPVEQVGEAKNVAPIPTTLDVVSASPVAKRPRRSEVRLLHGLLRFPLGEAADTRRPRW